MPFLAPIGAALGASAAAATAVGAFAVGSTALTVASIAQQRKAGKASQRQYEAEQRKAQIENVQKVRQQIRAARMQQSAMVNQAALSGGMGSSGLAGGTSSVASQLAGNLSYMSDIATENTTIGNEAIRGARYGARAQVYGQVGKLANTIFSDLGGWPEAMKGPGK